MEQEFITDYFTDIKEINALPKHDESTLKRMDAFLQRWSQFSHTSQWHIQDGLRASIRSKLGL